jgi:protein SCO1/2
MFAWSSFVHASRRNGPLAIALWASGLAACENARFKSVAYDPPTPAPAVVLTRADGSSFAIAKQTGKVVVLFFGYTHCPDICPTTLSDWTKAKHDLGPLAKRVRFVFVSVDPARDTPEITQRYAASFDPEFIGLTGDSATIAVTERAFHVSSSREYVQSSREYAVVHAGQTFVIDPKGKLRLLSELGMPYAFLVSDIKRLLNGA